MTSQELETAIVKGKIPTLCCLYGEETFLIDRAVKLIIDKAVDPSLKDFNFNIFYGAETKGVDILDAAQTLPMFSDRRAVLVKRAEAIKVELLDLLLPYIQNPATTTCLIFCASKIDQRKKFFQEFKKHGEIVEFKKLYDNKLPGFIQAEVAKYGKSVDSAAIELLAQLTGNNLQELSSQIEKLVTFSGENRKIAVDDVKTVASSSKAFTAFEFAKYLGMRDLQNSLKSLNALFRDGEVVPAIIGALVRHFRQLWLIRELLDRKVSQADIGRELAINSFFLGEKIQQAKNFSREELLKLFERLYGTDLSSKSGGQPYTLMHVLVDAICNTKKL